MTQPLVIETIASPTQITHIRRLYLEYAMIVALQEDRATTNPVRIDTLDHEFLSKIYYPEFKFGQNMCEPISFGAKAHRLSLTRTRSDRHIHSQ